MPESGGSESRGRWLLPEPHPAARNMALDQALLEAADAGGSPTLRFYRWSEPTLSLGYFQPLQLRETHRESGGLVAVRRATGGGAIVHHHELTYSLAVRLDSSVAGARMELYRGVHHAFAATLAELGLDAAPHHRAGGRLGDPDAFLCFQRRSEEDLIASGYKLLGSAQRRCRSAILQHGSLLLRASPHAPQLPGLEELAATTIDLPSLAQRITERIASRYRWRLEPATLDPQEIARAEQIERERFGNPAWLGRK